MTRHQMRKFKTEEEMKKHQEAISKRQIANTTKFSWPNTIIWKEWEIKVLSKHPNFAIYMMGQSQLNRKIYLSKDVYLRWLKDHSSD
jgi:hypothetical protein